MRVRQFLAGFLILLMACPGLCGSGVLGTIESSKKATVGGLEATRGTAVVSGDVIDVGEKGGARIDLAAGGMMRLDQNTQIRVGGAAEKIEFELTKGRAAFRFPSGPMQARLADATIASANGREVTGLIEILSPTRAVIASAKGELLVTASATAKSVKLREGEGVEVTVAPPSNGSAPAGLSRGATIVIGAVVAGVLTATALAFTIGRSKPSDEQKKNAVSPSRFP